MRSYKLDFSGTTGRPRLVIEPDGGRARRWAGWGGAAGLAALGLWWWSAPAPTGADGVAAPPVRAATTAPAALPAQGTGQELAAVFQTPASGPASLLRVGPQAAPAAPAKGGVFELDAAGRLRLDERMRLKMENLVVLTPPERLAEALEQELAGLPAQAAAAARDLVARYQSYTMAEKLASPEATAPLVPEEGLAELARLRALRESHFGRETAQRLYGEEEAVTRRLLELMRDDPVPHAPMEEKAMRAQARFDAERLGPQPDGKTRQP